MRPLEGSKVFHKTGNCSGKLDQDFFLKFPRERGHKWPRRSCKVSAKSYKRKILRQTLKVLPISRLLGNAPVMTAAVTIGLEL